MAGLLTPMRFAYWIGDHDPNDIIGRGFTAKGCPIATYLESRYGGEVSVLSDGQFTLNGEKYPLPRWAERFVEYIDSWHPRHGRIKAWEALNGVMYGTGWAGLRGIIALRNREWMRAA